MSNSRRKISRIIIHCSAFPYGDARQVDEFHRQRGFDMIGYHFVILNGRRTKDGEYNSDDDGLVELGRPIEMEGAHTKGKNSDSIGICLIGLPEYIGAPEQWFTRKQLESLRKLVAKLMRKFTIPPENIHGHNEYAPKLCPGFNVKIIREWWKDIEA